MIPDSLTQNEEHNIWKTILDCMPQLYFRPQYMCFPSHLFVGMIPSSSGQLAELIVYIVPLEKICIVIGP